MLDLGHVHGPPVGPAEAQVARLLAEYVDFLEDRAIGRHDGNGSLAVAGDIEVAGGVAAHAVEAVVRELPQQPLLAEAAVLLDRESPDIALHAFIDVERLAVRTDLD